MPFHCSSALLSAGCYVIRVAARAARYLGKRDGGVENEEGAGGHTGLQEPVAVVVGGLEGSAVCLGLGKRRPLVAERDLGARGVAKTGAGSPDAGNHRTGQRAGVSCRSGSATAAKAVQEPRRTGHGAHLSAVDSSPEAVLKTQQPGVAGRCVERGKREDGATRPIGVLLPGLMDANPLVGSTQAVSMFRRLMAVLAVCVALSAQACGAGDDIVDSGTTTVADSAGVRIVEHVRGGTGGARGDLPFWSIAEIPNLSIDSVVAGSGEARELDPVLARVFEDGQVAVLEGQRIFVFDRSGSLVRTLGGRGEGPGEYRQIQGFQVTDGDTLVVWDAELARLTIYPHNHEAVGRVVTPWPVPGQFPTLVGVGDGSLLLREGVDFGTVFAKGTGAQQDTALVIQYNVTDSRAEIADTLGAWPGVSLQAWVDGGSFSFRALPFGSQTRSAFAGGRLYLAFGDRYEVQVWDVADGTMSMSIRERDRQRQLVGGADRSEYEAKQLDEARDRAAEQSLLRSIEYPSHKPAYARLLVDDSGRIWVQETDRSGPWRVFGTSGDVEGVVRFPDEFVLHDVRGDEVIGLYTVNVFHKSVRSYTLVRAPNMGE